MLKCGELQTPFDSWYLPQHNAEISASLKDHDNMWDQFPNPQETLAAGKAKLAICSAKYDCRVTLHLHRLLVFHQTML